jgi:uncharacterized HAD superfamily protein
MKIQFKSLADLAVDIRKHILPKLPRDIGIVYGCPRSGMIPASIIATAIGADLGVVGQETELISGKRKSTITLANKGERILLVDDSINSGTSMELNKKILNKDCLTCAIYTKRRSKNKVDIAGPCVNSKRLFEWQFHGTKISRMAFYDMDGVICEDPTVYDDDGIDYQNNLINAKPLYLPQVRVRGICTNRLERWRDITVQWLERHGVQYQHLIMQPFDTAKERRKHSNPGEYKAMHYKKSKAVLFVESHDKQARVIADLSGKNCLSIENMKMF